MAENHPAHGGTPARCCIQADHISRLMFHGRRSKTSRNQFCISLRGRTLGRRSVQSGGGCRRTRCRSTSAAASYAIWRWELLSSLFSV